VWSGEEGVGAGKGKADPLNNSRYSTGDMVASRIHLPAETSAVVHYQRPMLAVYM